MKWKASYRCECGGKYISSLPFQELRCLDCGKLMKAHLRRVEKRILTSRRVSLLTSEGKSMKEETQICPVSLGLPYRGPTLKGSVRRSTNCGGMKHV